MSAATIPLVSQPCAASGCRHSSRPGEAICDRCSVHGRRSVQLLTGRWLQLRAALVPGRKPSGGRISRARIGSRPPVSAGAMDALEIVERLLLDTDRSVRAVLDLPARSYVGVRAVVNVVRCSTLIVAQWDRVTPLAMAGPLVDDFDKCRARVDRVLGLVELVHRLPLPCPQCDAITLVRYDGDAYVRCLGCGSSWSEAEYQHLVLVLVDEQRNREARRTARQ